MSAIERLRTKLQGLSKELDDDEWGLLQMTFHLAEWGMRIQEESMSFNMQYLMLQNQMQHESRDYQLLSNVLKTKHDTVRNTISNIR